MSGTKLGGQKAAATNRIKHGKDFYARIGRKGGKNGHNGGFAAETIGRDGLTGPERAKKAGAKGGKISRRGISKRHGGNIHELRLTDEQIARIKQELEDAEDAKFRKVITK